MVSCAQYCMFISAPGCIFLTYLGFLVTIGSETLYIVPKSRVEGAFALFISAFLYAIFFAISYNSEYSGIQRANNIDQWINEHDIKMVEMEMREVEKNQIAPIEEQKERLVERYQKQDDL